MKILGAVEITASFYFPNFNFLMKNLFSPLIASLILFTLIACDNSTAQVSIGLKGCYTLNTGEKQINPSKIDLDQYEKVKVNEVTSYINKLIVSSDEKRYFSFVLADLPDVICSKVEKDNKFSIVEKTAMTTDSTVYNFYKIKNANGLLVNKVVFRQPDLSNSIMMDAVFKNEEEWNLFYTSKEAFIKQMKCGKK